MKWGARVVRVRSVSREEVWVKAGVQGALFLVRYEDDGVGKWQNG